MVSFLPLPGGYFALANRTLSPCLVLPIAICLTFMAGICIWLDILVHVLL
jgi:hypothetical protein